MFIYACIFWEYNDMIFPSLSLHMKGIFLEFFSSMQLCLNQAIFFIVFKDFSNCLEEKSENADHKMKTCLLLLYTTEAYCGFEDACMQVQLRKITLSNRLRSRTSCNTIHVQVVAK